MSTQPLYPYTRVRQPGTYAASALSFNLDLELRRLESEKPWQAEHTAKTLVKHPDFRIVLVALRAGARLREHKTAGRISVHMLSGYLRVRVAEKKIELPQGSLLALDRGVSHEIFAQVDTAFLLTITWPDLRNRAARVQPFLNRPAKAAAPLAFTTAGRVWCPAAAIPLPEYELARERGLDKTLADSFPCSDAFSSIPDPLLQET